MNNSMSIALSGTREPFPGLFAAAKAEETPPRPLQWCSMSARTYATARGLLDHAELRRPGPLDERLARDAKVVAHAAVAEAVALGVANLAQNAAGAAVFHSKCAQLCALLDGIIAESQGRVRFDASDARKASEARQELARAIRSTEKELSRADTMTFAATGPMALTAASRLFG